MDSGPGNRRQASGRQNKKRCTSRLMEAISAPSLPEGTRNGIETSQAMPPTTVRTELLLPTSSSIARACAPASPISLQYRLRVRVRRVVESFSLARACAPPSPIQLQVPALQSPPESRVDVEGEDTKGRGVLQHRQGLCTSIADLIKIKGQTEGGSWSPSASPGPVHQHSRSHCETDPEHPQSHCDSGRG